MRKACLRITLALFSAVLLIFIITAFRIIYLGINDNIEKSDVGIILGSKVNPDGTLSSRLKARLGRSVQDVSYQMLQLIL